MKNQCKRLMIGLLIIGLLLVSACAKSADNESADTSAHPNENTTPAETGESSDTASGNVEELIIGTTTPNDGFNILTQAGSFGRTNYNCLANGDFVYRDADFKLKPYFLKSFDISEDGKVLTMTFPTDAIFHDGQPVTVDDVVFTFEYRRDVIKAGALKHLEKIEAQSDDTVVLTFSEPEAYAFLAQSSGSNHSVIPKHVWKDITEYKEYTGDDAAIGCGPYKLVSKDTDAGISKYEAVPQNSYLGDLTVDKITLRSYSNQEALIMAMIQGDIDVMFDYASPIDDSLMDLATSDPNIDPGLSDYTGHYQLYFGMERAPGNDQAFREAVVKSLNWDLLIKTINGEHGEIPGSGIISPSTLGFDDSLWKLYQDVDEAKSILEKAGYQDQDGDGLLETPDGEPIKLKVTPQFASKKQDLINRIADIIMASLGDIGIATEFDTKSLQSSEVWEANVIDGDYDLFIGYTTSGMGKYSSAFRYYAAVDREGKDEGSTWLWGTNHDPEFNQLIWKLAYSPSEKDYIEYITQLQKIASETLFGCALCWEKSAFPYRTDKYTGFDNWRSWGVVNPETFYRIKTK